MAEKKTVKIDFTPVRVLSSLYGARPYNEKTANEVAQAVSDVLSLIEPVIIYQLADVINVKDSQVRLSYGKDKEAIIHPGQSAGILKTARKALIAVWTISSGINEKIDEFNRLGDVFKAWIYDAAGLVALDRTYQAVKDVAMSEAREKGWGISPLLSPGSVEGWRLEEQQILCNILEAERFGIKLTPASVLIPFKSASGVLGVGPGYDKAHQGSMCLLCARNKTCSKNGSDK